MSKHNRMTAGEMAARLAATTGEDQAYFARQIRTWAPVGLFGTLERGGTGPTAPVYFNEYHLAMARIYSAMTRMGFDIRSLERIQHCGLESADRPINEAFRNGVWYVLDRFKENDRQWFLVFNTNALGDIQGGRYTRDPYRDPDTNIALSQFKPIELTINLTVLWRGLFDQLEAVA